MGYMERNLLENEKILYRAKISWAFLIFPVCLMSILIWFSSAFDKSVLLFSVLLCLYAFIRIALVILTTEFTLTDRRILTKKGVLLLHSKEILLSQVESLNISQPLDGRLFGFGTVTITGTGGTREFLKSMDNPMEFRKQVNNQISRLLKNSDLVPNSR